ncbi:MAG: LPS export ABC transporter permease LptF [Janthinobacterium lividum]
MIKIINFYIFKQLALMTFFITTILTTAIALTQSLRFIDVVLNRGFPISIFFQMILFLIPDLVSIILPISTLIALLFTYNRFFVDSELIVMRGSGFSNKSLAAPAFSFALIVALFLYGLNLYFLPLSFQHFRTVEHHVRNNITSYLIQPGEFNTFKGITVFAKERKRNGELKGLLIYDARVKNEPFTLIADRGLVTENSEGLNILMLNGNRQSIDVKTGKLNLLIFDSYSIDLTMGDAQTIKPRQKPYERYITDLLSPDPTVETPRMMKKFYTEAHKRLIIPLTVFCFTGIAMALFLTGDYNRRGRSKKISLIVVLSLLLQILIMTLINLSEKSDFAVIIAYVLVIICVITTFIVLKTKNNLKFSNKVI